MRPPVRPRHHHAEPGAAGAQCRRGRGLSPAHSRGSPAGSRFEPLMVLYLTDSTTPDDIRRAKASGFVHAAKLYPAGATTNSASGVTAIDNIFGVLETMAEVGLPLLVHGEVTRSEIDIFDREKCFIDEQLSRVTARFPTLKVVFEHITTRDAVQFVQAAEPTSAPPSPRTICSTTATTCWWAESARTCSVCRCSSATCTRKLLLDAATSGSPKFFLEPTRHPMRSMPRKPPAAALAATPPSQPSAALPKPSNSARRWTSWNPSPAISVLISMACRAIRMRSRWCARRDVPASCRSANRSWSRCALANACTGAWSNA